MAERLKILVSNDDGIYAAGIQTLVTWLCKQYDVYVFAPEQERSAMGHALTLHKPIRVNDMALEAPVKQACAVTGTPSDCVKIALNAVLDFRPDVVISGINHGPNLGNDVLYSGTVSAALEGAIHGIPSVAISLMNGYEKFADFNPSAELLCHYLPKILEANLPPKTILNLNTPAVSMQEMLGIKLSRLGRRLYTDTYERRVDPRGNVYYWLAGEVVITDDGADTDVMVVRDNYVAATPIQFDLTNYTALEQEGLHASLDVDDVMTGLIR